MSRTPTKKPRAEELSLSRPGALLALSRPTSPPRRRSRLASVLAALLIVAGLLLLADVGVTLLWQEPIHTRGTAHARATARTASSRRLSRGRASTPRRRRIGGWADPHPRDRRELRRREGHGHLRT
jgi:hypothetical protein